MLLVSLVCGLGGCTRPFYRKQSDSAVEEVLTEKNKYPAWAILNWHVYPDARARYADPTDPDHPPMPPDDPAAAETSPHSQRPYRKAGVARIEGKGYLEILAHWDAENRAAMAARGQKPESIEIPRDETVAASGARVLESNPDCPKPFLINLEQSAELGLINSREYQDRREDLYLTALPVTQERMSFSAQFFAALQAIRERSGRDVPGGHRNAWLLNSAVGFGKLFSTGALLLFSIANQTVIEMGPLARGQRHTTSVSTMTLDLIQPLLRGGGRAVTLEPLTQVERNLLYEIRTFARFRKEFFVSIAGGGGGSISGGTFVPTGVITQTTFTPAAGISGSAVVPGNIPAVPVTGQTGLTLGPGPAGRLVLTTAIPPNVSGFLGTLLQYVQIAVERENITRLQYFLKLFEATKEGGDIAQLQVDLVEQQLLAAYTTWYTSQQQYLDFLDRFKLQLGLPTDLPLELDEGPLRPLTRMFARYQEVLTQVKDVGDEALRVVRTEPANRIRAALKWLAAEAPLVRGTRFPQVLPGRWAPWERRSNDEIDRRLRELNAEHRTLLDRRAEIQIQGKPLTREDQERLHRVEFEIDLGELERALRRREALPGTREDTPGGRRRLGQNLADAFMRVMIEARTERLDILRRGFPELPPICVEDQNLLKVDLDEALAVVDRVALANRLDLMNARGQVVDAWRQIRVFANALLGVFNVEYRMQSFTPALQAKPLAFGGSRTSHQLVLDGSLPLVRWAERNSYRASLIAFQRQRRALMEAEDLAMEAVRGEIRQLRILAEQYKIQRRQLELAYLTVENSLDVFLAPPAAPAGAPPPVPGPGAPAASTGAPGGGTAATAAALTQQLLGAQMRLPLTQNQLLTVWVNYVNTRYQLYRDLELMPIDFRGVWIDDNASCDDRTGQCRPGPGGDQPGPGPRPGAQGATPGGERLPEPRDLPRAPEPRLEHPR